MKRVQALIGLRSEPKKPILAKRINAGLVRSTIFSFKTVVCFREVLAFMDDGVTVGPTGL